MFEYFDAMMGLLPALGFQIVGMDVSALFDISDELSDVLAVLDGRIARFDVLERDLVANRHIRVRDEFEAGIVMRDDTEHLGSGLQALDNDDADIVRVVMN
jgi:hypothetical protein